jgi:hypothetical protein
MHKLALILFSALSFATSSAFAASYQQTDGTIVDPILNLDGSVSTYSGPDLRPDTAYAEVLGSFGVDLTGIDLSGSSAPSFTASHMPDADVRGFVSTGVFSVISAPNADFRGVSIDLQIVESGGGGASLESADFRQSELNATGGGSAVFAWTDDLNLRQVDFSGANLQSFNFTPIGGGEADITGANFSNAVLTNVIGLGSLSGSAFYNANTDFTGATDQFGRFDPVAAGWTLVPEPSTALLMGLGLAGLASRRR